MLAVCSHLPGTGAERDKSGGGWLRYVLNAMISLHTDTN